jgi:hypothetical protein
VQEQCTTPSITETALMPKSFAALSTALSAPSWLNKQGVCPDPQIVSFEPTSGPVEGGTNLTIFGINLGMFLFFQVYF